MTNIDLVDVTVHVHENLDKGGRERIETALRTIDGVVSVHNPDDRAHLYVVEYNPDKTSSHTILEYVRGQNVRAELVGL
jgi:hypothetical protein